VTGKRYLDDQYAARTIRHNNAVISAFYEFFGDQGLGPVVNPVAQRVEEDAFWTGPSSRPLPHTGLRIEELLELSQTTTGRTQPNFDGHVDCPWTYPHVNSEGPSTPVREV